MQLELLPTRLPSFLVPFFTLSYQADPPREPDSFPDAKYYSIGFLDACFIITCIAVMAVLRDATRLGISEPFAHWFLTRGQRPENQQDSQPEKVVANGNGHAAHSSTDAERKRKREARQIHRSVVRFAEQGWSVIYYTLSWCIGMYIHMNLPHSPWNPAKLWEGYPHFPLPGPLKFYYLTQLAFYLHQILILNAEARRKDHWQMMAHHIITVALMVASYYFSYTRIGCLILLCMDWCDIWFPLTKMFRYLSLGMLCDATFTWFLLSWFITRHVLFVLVIKSVMYDGYGEVLTGHVTIMEYWGFLGLLVALQIIQIFWFVLICGVAWRVVTGQGASDTRSDDEDDIPSQDEHTGQNGVKAIPGTPDLRRRK